MNDRFEHLRLLEALLFAAASPLSRDDLARHLPEDSDLDGLMEELTSLYANRGVNLVQVGKRWAFRTASDLAPMMKVETPVKRRLSRAAVETLAIVAYHQPVTRADIEEIRGVALSRGTLDSLLEAGWIKPRGRRRAPGRPVTWGTTESFLDHFGLETLDSLPGRDELKAAGLLDSRPAIAALDARGELAQDQAEDDEENGADGEEELPLPADFEANLDLPDEDGADERAPDEAAQETDEAEDSAAAAETVAEPDNPEPAPEEGLADGRVEHA